jgi:hypothetical protein
MKGTVSISLLQEENWVDCESHTASSSVPGIAPTLVTFEVKKKKTIPVNILWRPVGL